MAVVAELVTGSGVRVRIHDDDMAPRGTEAAARIAREQCRAAREILLAHAGITKDDNDRRKGNEDQGDGRRAGAVGACTA